MSTAEIWRRRVILMAIVGLLVAIPVTLIVRGGDDDEPAAEPSIEEQLPLSPAVKNERLKASYQIPKGWKERMKKGVLRLQSDDGSVRIGLTAPAGADESGGLLADTLATLKGSYESVKISPGSGKKVGGLPAKGAVVHAEGDKINLSILVSVMSGKKLAYLLEVFTPAGAPGSAVAQAQQFLNSLKLQG
jgi:hypothetical protein